jgi:hypothetical protein
MWGREDLYLSPGLGGGRGKVREGREMELIKNRHGPSSGRPPNTVLPEFPVCRPTQQCLPCLRGAPSPYTAGPLPAGVLAGTGPTSPSATPWLADAAAWAGPQRPAADRRRRRARHHRPLMF